MSGADEHFPARHWHPLEDGRIRCDVCPRWCALGDEQRGLCFVRKREGDHLVLTTYGRSSGFVIDPIEKKPLSHFYPGSSALSFGTAGCNLCCKFCQNWDISKSRELDTLQSEASPEALADACVAYGCRSIAFTYNDPVVFLEYAVDTAKACRRRGVETVAVTAGYLTPAARADLFAPMTAANVDLKAFTEGFYRSLTASHLRPVLDTLVWLRRETSVWLELTTLLIPGKNDSDDELKALSAWVARELGEEVPLHFTAFHPDYRMTDVPCTPPATLRRARALARAEGLRHVYVGNVRDPEGSTTYCGGCGAALVERDGYEVLEYRLIDGACPRCGAPCAGRWPAGSRAESWGARRVRLALG